MMKSSLGEMLTSTFKFVMGAASEHKIAQALDPAHVVNNRVPSQFLLADQSYFQISLAEMFIRDRRQYWIKFLPFVLMLAEFTFDNATKSVPVFAGQDFDFLKSVEKFVQGESVQYKNIPLIGPVPYFGGGIKLFTGLFRTKNEDLANRIFDVVNSVARAIPIAELGSYMSLIGPLEKGVISILGIKDVQLRIGVAQHIKDKSDPNPTPSGYIVLVNAAALRGDLWLKDSELWIGAQQPERRFIEADYCLVRLDFSEERSIADLSFAKLWKTIKDSVWQGKVAEAEALLLELGRELAISPDLTTIHRIQLIGLYKVNLEREIELWNQIPGRQESAPRARRRRWTRR